MKRASIALWHLMRPYKSRLVGSFACLLLSSLLVLSAGQILRLFVDTGVHHHLYQAFYALIIVSFLLGITSFSRVYLTSWIGERIILDLKKNLFSKLLSLDQSYYDMRQIGDCIARLNNDPVPLKTVLVTTFAMAFRNGIQCLGALGMMFWTHATLTWMIFLALPCFFIPLGFIGKKLKVTSQAVHEQEGKTGGFATEMLMGLKDVRLFHLEKRLNGLFHHHLTDLFKKMLGRTFWRALFVGCILFLGFSAVSLLLWQGYRLVLTQELTPGDFSAFLFYAILGVSSLNATSELWADIQLAMGSFARIQDVLCQPSSMKAPAFMKGFEKASFTPSITFEKVSFAYPSRPEKHVLKDVSFHIPAGCQAAFVGPSGAGKSSLFHLLTRTYEPLSGRIYISGIPLENYDWKTLRGLFSVVPQDGMIFSGTLRENILFGLEEAKVGKKALAQAIKASYLEAFVATLPKGLETPVGERGIRLSGGQRQRVMIARALLKKGHIYLFDEATNALDSHSESFIHKALEDITCQKTCLVISHRLSTIRDMDTIGVLHHGHLQEQGSHKDLLAQKGLYASLLQAQLL